MRPVGRSCACRASAVSAPGTSLSPARDSAPTLRRRACRFILRPERGVTRRDVPARIGWYRVRSRAWRGNPAQTTLEQEVDAVSEPLYAQRYRLVEALPPGRALAVHRALDAARAPGDHHASCGPTTPRRSSARWASSPPRATSTCRPCSTSGRDGLDCFVVTEDAARRRCCRPRRPRPAAGGQRRHDRRRGGRRPGRAARPRRRARRHRRRVQVVQTERRDGEAHRRRGGRRLPAAGPAPRRAGRRRPLPQPRGGPGAARRAGLGRLPARPRALPAAHGDAVVRRPRRAHRRPGAHRRRRPAAAAAQSGRAAGDRAGRAAHARQGPGAARHRRRSCRQDLSTSWARPRSRRCRPRRSPRTGAGSGRSACSSIVALIGAWRAPGPPGPSRATPAARR